jgi:hypothetical protein
MNLAHKSGFAARVSPRRAQKENKNCHVWKELDVLSEKL